MSEESADQGRLMWTLFEPVHDVTYFTPEARAACEAAGLRGFWRGYFAGRAAPFGPIGAAPVIAAFFNFAPGMVARAIPDVWDRAAPPRVLQARLTGAVAALSRLADGQAATVLREHRGDGHVAALVAADVGGCEVLAWRAASDLSREGLQPHRGWSDEEWDGATRRLVDRGWLDAGGKPTDTGVESFRAIERATDVAAAGPWRALGADRTQRLRELLTPIASACFAELPPQMPVGLPAPGRVA